jgi:hypothetical protein
MKKMLIICTLLIPTACAHKSSVLVSGANLGQHVSTTHRTFLWGFASDAMWDPRASCPNGIAKVDVTSIFSMLGVYASYDLVAWCAAPLTVQGMPMYSVPQQPPGYILVPQ